MQNEKPKQALKGLGHEAVLHSEVLENDLWANNLMRDIGKTMAPAGMTYAGSATVHFYVGRISKDNFTSSELAMKHQIIGSVAGDGLQIAETAASFAIADLALKMRQHYHPEHTHKTTNTKDRR